MLSKMIFSIYVLKESEKRVAEKEFFRFYKHENRIAVTYTIKKNTKHTNSLFLALFDHKILISYILNKVFLHCELKK